ncbi:Lpp/OprI family alanine-zipper lipoprotein [Thalassotalea euphylliae]|uniref:Lpp/OprI family alanine-zipper lipoprotein n=1 Tax=Thalassotalea euphylliae TaxID=1655234 RepID=UPI00362FBE1F
MIKMTVIAVASVVLFTGCSNTGEMGHMTRKIDNLTARVQALSEQVNELKAQQKQQGKAIETLNTQSHDAAMAVEKANQRLDNMVATYKK